ncbi:hypothetical protein QOZ80_7BG0582960 [Eleusine coracana subsp. coracana]|nr:hypothetical protein QOZ80_7BG0582960 [Eleusine coracana subsp. coracana]
MMLRQLVKVASRHNSNQRLSSCLLCALSTLQSPPTLTRVQDWPLNQRSLSTESYPDDLLCSKKAMLQIESLPLETQDFGHRFVESNLLSAELEKAMNAVEMDFDLEKLKELYYRFVRPELLSRLLIHNRKFEDGNTHWLNYQTHARMGDRPRFTTCYDIMVFLAGLHKEFWVFYLDYLARERIAVIEEWTSISTTQHLFYNLGLKDLAGITFYKGEADASWHQHTATADLSNLIWEGNQVLSSITYLDVTDCKSSAQSEGKSAFAILKKAKELGIENFIVWTDSKEICGVLDGTKHISPDDKNWKLYMAIRSLRPSFKRLIAIWVPRELMSPADGMLRQGIKNPRYLTQSAAGWKYILSGLPIFKLSLIDSAKKTVNTFGKPCDGETKNQSVYIEIESDIKKVSAIYNLIKVLKPQKVYIVVKNAEGKSEEVKKGLLDLVGNSLPRKLQEWCIFYDEPSEGDTNGSLMIMFDGICDESSLPPLPPVNFTVIMSVPQDQELLRRMGVGEISASSFIYFHGACSPTSPGKKKAT